MGTRNLGCLLTILPPVVVGEVRVDDIPKVILGRGPCPASVFPFRFRWQTHRCPALEMSHQVLAELLTVLPGALFHRTVRPLEAARLGPHHCFPLGLSNQVNPQEEAFRQRYLVNGLLALSVHEGAAHQELAGWDKRRGQRDTAWQRQRVLRYAWANTRSDQFHDTGLPCNPLRVLVWFATGGEQFPMQPEQFTTPWVIVLLQVVRQDELTGFLQWVGDNARQQSLKCVHSGILLYQPAIRLAAAIVCL